MSLKEKLREQIIEDVELQKSKQEKRRKDNEEKWLRAMVNDKGYFKFLERLERNESERKTQGANREAREREIRGREEFT